MYRNELIDRRNLHYPPVYRLIQLTLKHRDQRKIEEAATHLANRLKQKFGARILGPEAPGIARIRNFYHQNILFKIESKASIKKAKELLKEELQLFAVHDVYKSVRVVVDVDPV